MEKFCNNTKVGPLDTFGFLCTVKRTGIDLMRVRKCKTISNSGPVNAGSLIIGRFWLALSFSSTASVELVDHIIPDRDEVQ